MQKPFPQQFVYSGIFRGCRWKLCYVFGSQYELLLWRTVSDEQETVNFTLHTNGNVIYNFKEEYRKSTMLERYTSDSKSISDFRQTWRWRITLGMSVENQLVKQSSDNCYLTIQWRIHGDIVCENRSSLKTDSREKILAGIKQSDRAEISISVNAAELWSAVDEGVTDHLAHLMGNELSTVEWIRRERTDRDLEFVNKRSRLILMIQVFRYIDLETHTSQVRSIFHNRVGELIRWALLVR